MSATIVRLTLVVVALMASACGAAPTSGPGTDDAALSADAGPKRLPYDVERALAAKCQRCHGTVPLAGVPFPLVTYADSQAPFLGRPVWETMIEVLRAGTMPAAPPALSPDEQAALTRWLDAKAPPAAAYP